MDLPWEFVISYASCVCGGALCVCVCVDGFGYPEILSKYDG